jgi:ribosome-associated protein
VPASAKRAGSHDIAVAAARAAADKQAFDVTILDVAGLIVITDYFVICSGSSDRHVKTIVEEVEKALRDLGERPIRREGEADARWVLLDYVDAVVHVFAQEEREYYDLERLWSDAPRVSWEVGRAAAATLE